MTLNLKPQLRAMGMIQEKARGTVTEEALFDAEISGVSVKFL